MGGSPSWTKCLSLDPFRGVLSGCKWGSGKDCACVVNGRVWKLMMSSCKINAMYMSK